jgi:hypothetical protein
MTARRIQQAVGVCLFFLSAVPILAQSGGGRFELGAHVAAADSGQFDTTDVGIGGRFSWSPVGLLGLESEISFYPREFPHVGGFSRARIEGLFGATVGPTIGGVRPFAKGRFGFLNVRAASQPFACILIFPPPLSCQLGAGRTLPEFDLGGGLELFASRQTYVRVELGDRLLRYPGPALDTHGRARDQAFFDQDFRFAAGAGLRF